ncbi:MAG: hypothetical protein EKK59_10130 [Neisseriaceae bacterium]|nr:MAG: hypothetical protein EKK59_10130 [Neisseriaceae bacterium]
MKRFVVLDKKIGETPLMALTAWKHAHPAYQDVPAAYAGRLDPMASGKLLVLLGDTCKEQSRYTGLDKEYEVSVLLDVESDTGDTLGIPSYGGLESHPYRARILEALAAELGSRSHEYPPYSSKTVNGTPLFLHALRGTLHTITIPTHTETIHAITLVHAYQADSDFIRNYIQEALSSVPRDDSPSKELGADFRQDAIRAAWQELFDTMPARTFVVLKLRVVCGSGAYMRTLAERIGRTLGTSALALSIHRTKVGTYRRLGPIHFFLPSF